MGVCSGLVSLQPVLNVPISEAEGLPLAIACEAPLTPSTVNGVDGHAKHLGDFLGRQQPIATSAHPDPYPATFPG